MKKEIKFYEVHYTKKVGSPGAMTVKARTEAEALSNAINICFTGNDFKVIKEVNPTNTAKGSGIAIGK